MSGGGDAPRRAWALLTGRVSPQVVDVLHNGRPGLSKDEVKNKLAKMYNIDNPSLVVVYGFRTQFGGGKTTGFGLIYDNLTAAKKFDPRYRLLRVRAAAALSLFAVSGCLAVCFSRAMSALRRCAFVCPDLGAVRSSPTCAWLTLRRAPPQSGLVEKKDGESRKLRKEKKNRAMKKVGKERAKILYGK